MEKLHYISIFIWFISVLVAIISAILLIWTTNYRLLSRIIVTAIITAFCSYYIATITDPD